MFWTLMRIQFLVRNVGFQESPKNTYRSLPSYIQASEFDYVNQMGRKVESNVSGILCLGLEIRRIVGAWSE